MISRFSMNPDGSYSKTINHMGRIFIITIPKDIWSTVSRRKILDHVQYWKRRTSAGFSCTMKYGTIEEQMQGEYTCDRCHTTYKTRAGLYKHKKANECVEITDMPGNTTIQNITNNQQTNNININFPSTAVRNFADENPNWLTTDVVMSAIANIPDAISNLIREKHFNDKFPENQNVRLDTRRNLRKRLRVFDGGRWKIRDRPDVEYDVISQVYDVMSDLIELIGDDEPSYDDTTPIDSRISHISRLIRASKERTMRVKRIIKEWKKLTHNLRTDYDKSIEPLSTKFDTLLLDNELRLQQLEIEYDTLQNTRTILA